MDKELAKVLSRLAALKNNIPQKGYGVPEKYVEEFHSILQTLEKVSGENLAEFVVPIGEVRPRLTSIDGNRKKNYSTENYCDLAYISMKIDGVLGYFTISLQPQEIQNKLGFDVEERES